MTGRVSVRAVLVGIAVWSCALFGVVGSASGARHYEKVTPADKGQGDIVADGATTVAARIGDAVAFNTRTPFGDTEGSGQIGQTHYVARRTATAWETHAITPMPAPDALQLLVAGTRLQIFSADLRNAVVRAYDLPAVGDDTPDRINLYVEDTATRTLEPVTVSQMDSPGVEFVNYPLPFWGVSEDARAVAFVSFFRYTSDAAQFAPNVYQWNDGVLRLAGILPNGTVPPTGSNSPTNLRGAMSADGSRLLFTATTVVNPQLYMRIGGTRAVWVSETEMDPGDPGYDQDPSGVEVRGMTPDGQHVFFTTNTPLLPGDGNGGADLYRYTDSADPSNDRNLVQISRDGTLGDSQVIGFSDDGDRVYYRTNGADVVVWDHGVTRVIARTVAMPGNISEHLGLTAAAPGLGRVTPDGRYMAFASSATLNGEGILSLTGEVTNGHREMYLYSLDDGTLRCISCPVGIATADVEVLANVTEGNPVISNAGLRPRFLSDDGEVFFSTAEPLVPGDVNGVRDVYEFDPAAGKLNLLSTGKGTDPSGFADASATGDDVFIATRQRLVASDRDDLVDLYDVRNGSALPEPPQEQTPACQADACQAPPSASPPEDLLGSLSFERGDKGAFGTRLLAVRKRLVLRGGAGSLSVKLLAPGRLTWRGRGLRSGSIRRSRRGTYAVRLRLAAHARARLQAAGIYSTSVRLTFVSIAGDEISRTTRVTFRLAAKKGR